MAKCHSCSAPLPANTQFCRYCGVRNDIDIRGKHEYRIIDRQSARICPACNLRLQTIALDLQPPLEIERCRQCFGLFFDPGEVEALLDSTVSPVFEINSELLGNINNDRYPKNKPVKYQKCPVCRNLMNRVVFAHRSGVVIDQCKLHGIWLDGGEITHLLEWKKAGGQILHEKKQMERQQQKRKTLSSKAEIDGLLQRDVSFNLESDLLETVASLIFKVFE